ncbi:MAG: sensor histidine kinase [Vicinamibacterales bacterium]
MRADPRTSLGARIFLLAAINLVLIAGIGVAASGVRFPHNRRDVVLQASGKRVHDMARDLATALEHAPAAARESVLAQYEATYNQRIRLILVTNDATRIAGADVPIPADVASDVTNPRAGGPPPRRRPPPRNRDRRPGPTVEEGDPADRPRRDADAPGQQDPPPFLVIRDGAPRYWVGVRIPIRAVDQAGGIPGTLLILPDGLFTNPLLFPSEPLRWGLIAVAVTVVCWVPLLRNLTRSLGRMEHATAGIAEGRFDTALDVRRRDEVGRLARSIERMARRLEEMVRGQKRFLGDTAHELRSPIARMQVALELLERRADAADGRHLADLREDVEEMSRLTDDLLQLARSELAVKDLVLRPVVVDEAIARAVRLESRPGVAIEAGAAPGVSVLADADLLVRAIANVLRNAVRYAASAGPIRLDVQVDTDQVHLVVSDQGPGVPDEALARLFSPFFRVEAARDRRSGGAGLGLAIVRSAVDACGAGVTCRNLHPGFEVRLTWRRA